MGLINDSGMGALWTVTTAPPHRHVLSCVVKARCPLQAEQLQLSDQPVFPTGPEWLDDDPEGPLLWAGDFAPMKEQVDILFRGSCHLPDGSAESQIHLAVGDWSKELIVSGERRWQKSFFKWSIGPTTAVPSVPLDGRYAFGGPGMDRNPWGRGYKGHMAAVGDLLPQIEYPQHRMQKHGQAIPAAGLGPLHQLHPIRQQALGTFDDRWAAEVWPELPKDFSPSAFNSAPPDQRISALQGNEEIFVQHLLADQQELRTRLPALRPRWFYAGAKRLADMQELTLQLDTLAIDSEQGFVDLVWRGLIPITDPDAGAAFEHYICQQDLDATAASHADISERWAEQLDIDDEEILSRRQTVVNRALAAVGDASRAAEPWTRAQVDAELAAGKDFTAANLRGLDLSGCDFSAAILAGADLSEALLNNANFSRAVLLQACCDRATLRQADLTEADCGCASFKDSDLTEALCTGADCTAADFSGARADGCSWIRVTRSAWCGMDHVCSLARKRARPLPCMRCNRYKH